MKQTIYILHCLDCVKEAASYFEIPLQSKAEEHMMATGHIVEIEEA